MVFSKPRRQHAYVVVVSCLIHLLHLISAQKTRHTANYAVIVNSSRYWFNYRHASNAFSVYQLLKDQGFHDDNIILMVADEYALNPRNPIKNTIFNTATDSIDGRSMAASTSSTRPPSSLFTPDTIIDYRSEDVTVENLLRVLTGRGGSAGRPVLPNDDPDANILIYLTGHGGDQFFKFQDVEEIVAQELSDVIGEMRFKNLLLVADTCQAFTLGDQLHHHTNVAMLGTSLRGQSSYAHSPHPVLGLAVIEKYTHYFVERARKAAKSQTIRSIMVDGYPKQRLGGAEIGLWDGKCEPDMSQVPWSDFFHSVAPQPLRLAVRPVSSSTLLLPTRRKRRQVQDTTTPADPSTNTCSATNEGTCTDVDNSKPFIAMEPNDPWFLSFILFFIGVPLLASYRW